MNSGEWKEIRRAADEGEPVSTGAAVAVLRSGIGELSGILCRASAARSRRFGNRAHLCSVTNARSGACAEDCAFCAQSSRHGGAADVYGLRSEGEILESYEEAGALPIDHFGIVTSGEALDDGGVERVCRAVRRLRGRRVKLCASLGTLADGHIAKLKEAGVVRLHHNLETAESFFPRICGTHGYRDRIATVRRIKANGMQVCCGGILGLGETDEQRVELAAAIRGEGVDSIPLNFFLPIPGTPLENRPPMKPLEILRCIAMFRLMNPATPISICAGRPHLCDLQAMIFFAGATGMMIGPLLTVAGEDAERDRRMLQELGMECGGGVRRETGPPRGAASRESRASICRAISFQP